MKKSFSQRSLPVVLLLSGSLLFTTGCTDGGASAAQSGPSHPGKAVYNDYCYSCHNAGISGAPRLGDVDEWRPRIAKGKAHKKCEFGCKVIVAIISKDNFMVGAQVLHGTSYDGHTLNE